MFIETVPNRDSPPAVLLRESYRDEQGHTQKRTLANLSKLPRDMIDTLKAVLKGGTVVGTGPQELEVERSLPHGHVAAAFGMIRKIGLDRLILSAARDPASRRRCDLVVAMMVDRLIAPRSKLGFVRAVDEETAISHPPGGCLRAARTRSCPCPVTETPRGRMIKPRQILVRFMCENFSLAISGHSQERHRKSANSTALVSSRSLSFSTTT